MPSRASPTTLASTDGGAHITTDGAYSSSTDHLVLRVDPRPPASIGGDAASNALVYDITCYWSLTGVELHSFSSPLEIVLATPPGDPVVPVTLEYGTWRPIPLVPTPGILPFGWSDGYFAGAGGIHILTAHLSEFTLLHDRFPPPPPRDVNGVVADDGLTLRWTPGSDPTGPVAQVQLYVDGRRLSNFDTTQLETKLGPILAGDPRIFTFTDTDPAGNISVVTTGLRALPPLLDRSLAEATQALAAAGFATGTVTRVPSDAAVGTVISPADVEVRPLGSAIDLAVSAGQAVYGAPFTLRALAPRQFRPAQHRTIVASVAVTGSGTSVVVLLDARGHRLASWRVPLRAGLNHPRLLLPAAVRKALVLRPGTYWLSWSAQATAKGARSSDRQRVLMVSR